VEAGGVRPRADLPRESSSAADEQVKAGRDRNSSADDDADALTRAKE
jgi:hypothetical protein